MAAVKNYFQYFPKIDFLGRQIIDLTKRATFLRDIKDDYRLVGMYKVKSGETPWGLAHDFYGSEEYDWIIFGLNDIVNPLFDWCISQVELDKLIELKYPGESRYDIHHYVFEDRIYYEPVIFEERWSPETEYRIGQIVIPTIVNAEEQAAPENTYSLPAVPFRFKIVNIVSDPALTGSEEPVWPSGFGDQISDGDYVWENIGPYAHPESVFVTNQEHEEIENEKKRIIKILRPRYLTAIVAEFDKTMRGVVKK